MPGIYSTGQYFDGRCLYDLGLGDYGLGTDGTALLDGTNTFSWATKIGNRYVMLRDIFLDNLTVNNGKSLEVAGFRIFAKTKTTVVSGGIIRSSYLANGTPYPSGTVGGSGWGGFGSFYDGRDGQSVSNSLGGNGGAGGASTQGAPGAGGIATAPTAALGGWKELHNLIFGHIFGTSQMTMLMGGAGGGGTAGNAVSATGLSGGAGAGALVLVTRTLDVSGTGDGWGAIQARGSDGEGDDGSPGDSQVGGGGGGGGGFIACVYQDKAGTGNLRAAGGEGGLGQWSTGSNGSDGNVFEFQQAFAR